MSAGNPPSVGSLEATGITHAYGPVVALSDVDFALHSGRVHALLGENGCGKSTLIKIMTGAQQPTKGSLTIDGVQVTLSKADSAQAQGIAVVHQNYHLFPDLPVLENIVVGNTNVPRSALWFGGVDRGSQKRHVRELLAQLGIDMDVERLAATLSPAERKFVEVARAMMRSPRFLFLDEPTASLEPASARRVLGLIEALTQQGVGVAYVSHRLDEVMAVADDYTVLRDARLVQHGAIKDVDEGDLVRLMVGDLHASAGVRASETPAVRTRFVVTGQVSPAKSPFTLEVKSGEVLALTGLVGSGASEVAQMLGGSRPLLGVVMVDGREFSIESPRDALSVGIGYIPEDRKGAGLVVDHAIDRNIAYGSLARVSKAGLVNYRQVATIAEAYGGQLDIRMAGVHSPVSSLSGGNQQKVLLAKLFQSGVDVLALEEPTQGVDVKGRAQIHKLLRDFAAQGGAVIIASTDVREVAAISDRVAVFRHGELIETLTSADIRTDNGEHLDSSPLQEYLVGVMESGLGHEQHDLVHGRNLQTAETPREEMTS